MEIQIQQNLPAMTFPTNGRNDGEKKPLIELIKGFFSSSDEVQNFYYQFIT
jgi:hypothetical protein